jgi:hypothetical protein
MKRSFVFTSLLLTFCLGGAPVAMAQAQPVAPGNPTGNPPTGTPVQGYPKPFAEGISKSCMEQAKQSSKLPPAVVTSYCQCVASQVQSRVSFADFVDLSNALNAKQTLNEQQTKNNAALTAGVQYCVSQQQPGTNR